MPKGLSFDQLYPGTYLKAGEFNGKPVTLTINHVRREMLSNGAGGEEGAVIVSFVETEKLWVMNKTCGVCLRAMWGDDSGEWSGHKVTLHPVRDDSGLSESGQCIRVAGSPELSKALTFRAHLGRKQITQTLKPTGKAPAAEFEDGPSAAQVAADDVPAPSGDTEPPGMDYDAYLAAQAPDDDEGSNVLPLHDPDGPATAAQLAQIKSLRREKKVNASDFATACDTFGGASTADNYGLTVASADLLIEELAGRDDA